MANCLRWLILFLFLGNVVFADENKVRCVVHGKLVGMEVEDVLLVDATLDSRYHGTTVTVKNHCFECVLELPHAEGYKLIFVTRKPWEWYTVPFIAEDGKVDITVNVDKNYMVKRGKSPFHTLFSDVFFSAPCSRDPYQKRASMFHLPDSP